MFRRAQQEVTVTGHEVRYRLSYTRRRRGNIAVHGKNRRRTEGPSRESLI